MQIKLDCKQAWIKKVASRASYLCCAMQLMACSSIDRASEFSASLAEMDHSHLHKALVAQPFKSDQISSADVEKKAQSVHLIIEDSLHFESGSHRLSERSKRLLNKLAADLAIDSGLDVNVVELSGYTDAEGSDASNIALAQRRVNEVKIYLSGLINRELRWETRAYGEAYPLALSGDSANQYKNRRVELLVRAKLELKKL